MRQTRRPAILLTTLGTILASAVLSSTLSAQDWFRQRTKDGRTYPVTLAAEELRQKDIGALAVTSAATTYPATGLPLAIPDYPGPAVSSTITLPAIAQPGAIAVSLFIQHTYRGDLQVSLTSPGGTVFLLSDRAGGSADDIEITRQTLTLPAGGAVEGGWTLEIVDLAPGDVGSLMSWSLTIGSPAAQVDLSMSIESNPAGDNDGNTQGNPGSEAQDKWERIIQHFADAVYEMTNGAHTIGTVRVFRSGKNSASADIRWAMKGHPHVPANGGVASAGGHVQMFETFEKGYADGSDKPMLDDEQGSGYTMAHEWGHYYLGLYDEYAEACLIEWSCVSVTPSIMTSQWEATYGGTDWWNWLNFSIKHQSGGPFQDTLHNRQHTAYGASAWEVLARPVEQDPDDLISRFWQILGPRVYYSELASVAPVGTATPSIELDTDPAAGRKTLDIIWMSDGQDVEIVIDRSGSMAGTKLAQAKAAAKLIVDQAELGQFRYGVTAFDDTVTNVMSQTALDTEADRSAIKAAIDGIVAGNNTAVGDAAAAALAKLVALNAPGDNKGVFLLSDGLSNAGINPLSVIPSYAAAHVPLFTFGFGADADGAVLDQMATGTGGRYYFSPTTLAEITAAFQAANLVATSNPGLGAGSMSPTVSAPAVTTIPVDSAIVRLRLTVVYTGSAPTSVVSFLSPSGQAATPTSTDTGAAGEHLVYFDVSQPEAGNWKIEIAAAGAGSSYSYTLSGTQDVGLVVDTTLRGPGATPEVLILSRVSRRVPVVGATVFARVTTPGGTTTTFPLLDDGVGPDSMADDGTYSAQYSPSGPGRYTVYVEATNPGGTAVETYRGTIVSPNTAGEEAPLPDDIPVTEPFVRSQTTQFSDTTGLRPTITGFTPPNGVVGTSVTITGTNFTGATAVKFNGTSAAFSVGSATSIMATVPSGATSGPISVTTPGGTAASVSSFAVTVPGPTITGFTPPGGVVGTPVTITGTNLTGATAVKFNGTSAAFSVGSTTSITATVPSGATSGPISVTTPGGTATSTGAFTVVPAGDVELSNGVPYSDSMTATSAQGTWKYYYIDVPSGSMELTVQLDQMTADVDLYVRSVAKPDGSTYDCRPYFSGTTDETCSFASPDAGRWWIGVNNWDTGTISYRVTATFTITPGAGFYTVTPCRVLDSRDVYGWWWGMPLSAGEERLVPIGGTCHIPTTAQAVSLNVTAVGATAGGHIRVFPYGTSRPQASAVNFAVGQTRANNAIVMLGAGDITVFSGQQTGAVHVVIDVNGYFE